MFDFTNNKKLKESGFAVDNAIVNGYVTKAGVTLNVQAKKALNSVVGHEVAHVLEGTEMYNALQQVLYDYAKSKGEYDSRRSALTELYKNVKDADIDGELTADLVGDYLFSDTDFIRKLSVENRNIFQRIFDEIKYLCKLATAGSQEARQLEKMRKAFEDVYRESGKERNVSDSGTKHSLMAFEDGRRFVDVQLDQHIFDNLSDAEKTKKAKDVINERFAGRVIGIDNPVFVNGRTAREYGHPAKNIDSAIRDAKMRASTELDNLIDSGTNFRTAPDGADGHTHPDLTGDFGYFDTIFKVGNEYFSGVVNVEQNTRGLRLKDITQIKNITQDIYSSYGKNPKSIFLHDNSASYITQDGEDVKHSISKSDGNQSIQYSLESVDSVQPKNDKWSRTHTTEEAMAVFPDKRLDLFEQTVFTNVKKGTLPRRQVNKPPSIRPKRTAVRFPMSM